MRSFSTTTVAFFFGALRPSIRFARRKNIRPIAVGLVALEFLFSYRKAKCVAAPPIRPATLPTSYIPRLLQDVARQVLIFEDWIETTVDVFAVDPDVAFCE